MIGDTELSLRAEEMGDEMVHFIWTAEDGLADNTESWRLVYEKNENPTYPANWWWERSKIYREHDWKLPPGEGHVRVCAVVDDECRVYSNDVVVEVK